MHSRKQTSQRAKYKAKKKLIETEPSRDPLEYTSFLTFSVGKLGMRPTDFWSMTFGEFWPLYNSVMGHVIKPLSHDELESLEDAWTGASVGNT